MSMVVITIFRDVDASLSIKWNPGLIPWLLKDCSKFCEIPHHLLVTPIISSCSQDGIKIIYIHDVYVYIYSF